VAPDSEVVIDAPRSMNINNDVLEIIHESEAMPGTRIFNSPPLTWTNISPTAGLTNHNCRPFCMPDKVDNLSEKERAHAV
jgi:hypothetical protein